MHLMRKCCPFICLKVLRSTLVGTRKKKYIPNKDILANTMAMLSDVGDICMKYTYVHSNEWSRYCSEEGMLQGKRVPSFPKRETRTAGRAGRALGAGPPFSGPCCAGEPILRHRSFPCTRCAREALLSPQNPISGTHKADP